MKDVPKTLQCCFEFYVEDETVVRSAGDRRVFHFGPDGGVGVDLREYEASKHLLGKVHFDYDEMNNAHLLSASEYDEFKNEVDRCQPSRRQREQKEAKAAARIASQHSTIAAQRQLDQVDDGQHAEWAAHRTKFSQR